MNFYDERLNKRIKDRVIPKIKYERKINSKTYDQYYQKTISFEKYIGRKFNEDEYDYVLNYLNNEGIIVQGQSSKVFLDYDNYRYTKNKKSIVSSSLEEASNSIENRKMLEEYNSETDPEIKIQIRNRIAEKNMKYLFWVVNKISYICNINKYELLGAGYEGLISAIEKYDISKNCFSQYMKRTISGFVLSSMSEYYDFECLGTYNEVRKYKREIEKATGTKNIAYQDITDEVLEKYIEDNPKRRQFDMIGKFTHEVPDCFEESEIVDNNDKVEEALEKEFLRKMKEDIKLAMKDLSNKNKKVIMDLYGFTTGKPLTLQETGIMNDVTHEGANYRNKVALKTLSKNKVIKSYKNNLR